MKKTAEIVASLVFISFAGGAFATTPTATQHFDCSDGGDSSCAADDTGCVPADKGNLKCSDALAKGFAKAIASVLKCHGKQADAAFKSSPTDDETCEMNGAGKSAKEKLDAAITKVSALCMAGQVASANALETTLFAGKSNAASLDALNGSIYCQGTADIDGTGDDAGKVPDSTTPTAKNVLKCEDTVNKSLVGSSRVDLQACKLEYSIVSPK